MDSTQVVRRRHMDDWGARKERTSYFKKREERTSSSVAVQPWRPEVIEEESSHQQRAKRRRSVYEKGHTRQSPSSPFEVGGTFEPLNKFTASSRFLENSYPSQKAPPLFRRAGFYTVRPERRSGSSPECSFKTPPGIEDNAVIDLTKEDDEPEKMLDVAFPRGGSTHLLQKRGVQVQPKSGSGSGSPSGKSRLALKGKEKIDMNTSNSSGLAINCGEGTIPRKKRSVRIGCTSPSNIADSAQKFAEKLQIGSRDGKNQTPELVIPNGQSKVDIREIVADDYNCRHKAKGKGAIMRHSFTEKNHDADTSGHVSSSSSVAANEIGYAPRKEAVGRWRSTHSRGKEMDHSVSRDDDARCFVNEKLGNRKLTSNIVSGSDQQGPVGARLFKKRKTTEESSTSRNRGNGFVDDSKIHCSSRFSSTSSRLHQRNIFESASSTSSPPRLQNHQRPTDSPPTSVRERNSNVPGTGSACNQESDARARQLEADERLALELQAQMYNEMAILFMEGEAGSSQNHPVQSSGIPSNQGGTQVQVPRTIGAPQLRRRIMSIQRDFNANDYEMLLALDDNNVRIGASADQINSLPEFVLQTDDDFEETCAVCLDVPTVGETMRQLPCLHKFHKTCIDPWLTTKPSCPGSTVAMDVDDVDALEIFGEGVINIDHKLADADFFNNFEDDFDDTDIN
ncbi:hypothetical protein Tsubulata_014246 [Turnera subulata]|uniref:RING-type domain-containing protein n=1 Tax=Turnera subulata TaxID=218843 RepID=A0A9Q0G2D0_9ROSI|nr:hypothetical protein Tsubulata_014246 [Turnera subulata]